MGKKMLISIAGLALVLTGFSAQRSEWFSTAKPTSVSTTSLTDDPFASAEAARHCRCEPRHWRALVIHK